MTGYWGIPGGSASESTKVHYTMNSERYPKPLCGARLGPLMQFQFCSAGFDDRYIECGNCRRMVAKPPLIKLPRKAKR